MLVAITIGAILLVSAYVPYGYYSDRSRTKLSVERIEQLASKAKLLAATGYTPRGTEKNVDLALYLGIGNPFIELYRLDREESLVDPAKRVSIEKRSLESSMQLSKLFTPSTTSGVWIVYRSPDGQREVYMESSLTTPVTSFTGGLVGKNNVSSGSLSYPFLIP